MVSENISCFSISGLCFSILKVGVYFGLVYTVGQQEGAWSEVFIWSEHSFSCRGRKMLYSESQQ